MIELEHLSKTYRVAKKQPGLRASLRSLFSRTYEPVQAVADLSFKIQPGERVGFLGPNGAGKTTTLKMLAGLLTPTAGKVTVLGYDPRGRPRGLLEQITLVMGQKQQLLWDLPPIETLELNRVVYGVSRERFRENLERLSTMLGLEPLLLKPTRQLSLGERMKCELAAALMHDPKVLFLDEPTIGLDVTMQDAVRRFIREYNESTGATVLLTSHDMDDVLALCPRVIVIDHGRLRYDGDLRKLMQEINPKKVIEVHLSHPAEAALAPLLTRLDVVTHSPVLLALRCAPDQVTATLRALLEHLPVVDLKVTDPPLEETMKQLFGSEAFQAPSKTN